MPNRRMSGLESSHNHDTSLHVQATRHTTLYGHENRISCLKSSPDGTAICTASWDCTIRVSEAAN